MPATTRKRCPKDRGGCGQQFTPRRGTRRVFCFACRPEKIAAPPVEPELPAPPRLVEGEMTTKIRAELARLGQADSIPGVLALRLAQTLDDPRLSNAQVPGLVDKLAKILEPLIAAEEPEDDEVDEFTRRARERAESA